MKASEVNALISLLDDPDAMVYSHVQHRIISYGDQVVPALEDAWEHTPMPIIQDRIEGIIHKIQFKTVEQGLKKWINVFPRDLLEGILLINRYHYPELDRSAVQKALDQLIKEIWLELNDNLTALEKVNVINRVLFNIHNFGADSNHNLNPQNAFFNSVLDRKKGNPVSLGMLYLLIADRLQLPIKAINLPQQFVLAFYTEGLQRNEVEAETPLFFLTPFYKGYVFDRNGIEKYLEHQGLKSKPTFYKPLDNVEVLKRLLISLECAFNETGELEKSGEIATLMDCLNAGSS